jgi:hypothetical protein
MYTVGSFSVDIFQQVVNSTDVCSGTCTPCLNIVREGMHSTVQESVSVGGEIADCSDC